MNSQDKLHWLTEHLADKTLSFGCKLLIAENPGEWGEYEMTMTFEKDESTNDKISIGDREWTYRVKKILGHPITLARVLSKLEEKFGSNTAGIGHTYCVASNGNLSDDGGISYKGIFWNLEKDDISLQSPEVWSFLYNIFNPPTP